MNIFSKPISESGVEEEESDDDDDLFVEAALDIDIRHAAYDQSMLEGKK